MKPGFAKLAMSNAIINEYITRDVFSNAWVRTAELCLATLREMLADAEYYTDKYGPDISRGLRGAYEAHKSKIVAAIAEAGA